MQFPSFFPSLARGHADAVVLDEHTLERVHEELDVAALDVGGVHREGPLAQDRVAQLDLREK